MEKFKDAFGGLADPWAGNTRHNLLEVVFIALAATLCGAQSCLDMALFARPKEGFLREIVEMPHGPPSHDTFSRVFRRLDPAAFERAFAGFTRAFAAIRARGGNYALAVKASQPRLLAEVERLLDAGPGELAISDVEDRHDRAEVRRARIVPAPDLEEASGFPGACAVASVEAVRQTADGAETVGARFFILSTLLSAERVANVARARWRIENNLHWVLDVAFNEDAARNRAGHGAQNLARLRKLALNIIKADDETGSLKGKIKRAGWDEPFLKKLPAHIR